MRAICGPAPSKQGTVGPTGGRPGTFIGDISRHFRPMGQGLARSKAALAVRRLIRLSASKARRISARIGISDGRWSSPVFLQGPTEATGWTAEWTLGGRTRVDGRAFTHALVKRTRASRADGQDFPKNCAGLGGRNPESVIVSPRRPAKASRARQVCGEIWGLGEWGQSAGSEARRIVSGRHWREVAPGRRVEGRREGIGLPAVLRLMAVPSTSGERIVAVLGGGGGPAPRGSRPPAGRRKRNSPGARRSSVAVIGRRPSWQLLGRPGISTSPETGPLVPPCNPPIAVGEGG